MESKLWASFVAALVLVSGCDGTYSGEGCFPAGSLVETPEGARPIQDIKLGQIVYAFDVATNQVVTSPVDQIVTHRSGQFTHIAFDQIGEFNVTPDHPLWDADSKTWRPAGEFKEQSRLAGFRGTDIPQPLEIRAASVKSMEDQPVFNLKVRHYENAFVSGVLAHFY